MRHDASSRLFAARAAGINLLFSGALAVLLAPLLLGIWYPYPFATLLNMRGLLALALALHLGIGSGLTFLLSKPAKTRRALWIDWVLVACIQAAALLYGLFVFYGARPVVLAFERDRFVVVSAREISAKELALAPPPLQTLATSGPTLVGTRRPKGAEFFSDLALSLQGVEPSLRPSWWLPYPAVVQDVMAAARPLIELKRRRPEASAMLDKAAKAAGYLPSQLSYLPLTSSHTREWIVLLDSNATPRGYVPVDGFV